MVSAYSCDLFGLVDLWLEICSLLWCCETCWVRWEHKQTQLAILYFNHFAFLLHVISISLWDKAVSVGSHNNVAHWVNCVQLFQWCDHFKDLLGVFFLLWTQMARNQDQVINKCDHGIVVPIEFFFEFWQMTEWVFSFGVVKIVELLLFHNNDWFASFSSIDRILWNWLEFLDEVLIGLLGEDNVNVFLLHGF